MSKNGSVNRRADRAHRKALSVNTDFWDVCEAMARVKHYEVDHWKRWLTWQEQERRHELQYDVERAESAAGWDATP
jgi:coproporphyrinogen III oxidase-like Fe-S oxidoreductase